jgi:hypothetical protein
MWEGAPARLSGRCTELKRSASICQDAYPIWLLETLNILMQVFIFFWLSVVPAAAILWFARGFIPVGEAALSDPYFRVTPLFETVWHLTLYAFITTWVTIIVTSVLDCLFTAARPLGTVPLARVQGALLMYRMKKMNGIRDCGLGP